MIGIQLLSKIVQIGDVYKFFNYYLKEEHFSENEMEMFQFIRDHVENYSVLPKQETLEEYGHEIIDCPEPPEFYLDMLEDRFTYKVLQSAIEESSLLIKQDTKQTLSRMAEAVALCGSNLMRRSLVDLREQGQYLIERQYEETHDENYKGRIMLGWEYLDNMNDGLFPGDVVSYVGRPATGKTMFMLYSAVMTWALQGKTVLFASMEMPTIQIIQRAVALFTATNLTKVTKNTFEPEEYELFRGRMQGLRNQESSFWVLDGNLSVDPHEIYSIAAQYKADVVIIDGAYLLSNRNGRLDKYSRVADNLEYIKRTSQNIGIPSILSYQFNRDAARKVKKKGGDIGSDVGLEDVAMSDTVGQISSIVLGLFEDENTETVIRRRINILKGRNGETGGFFVNWDFDHMNFEEWSTPSDILMFE